MYSRKTRVIFNLETEQYCGNKSLKHKLLFGNKLCGLHAEESKKVQSQLKELRYGKKDLLFKAQQLTDLEQKLAVAKKELEKAALDRESQLKAMKETVQLCLSTVFRDQHPPHLNPFRPYRTQISVPTMLSDTRTAYIPGEAAASQLILYHDPALKEENGTVLMAAEMESTFLNDAEAQCVASQVQLFYATGREETYRLGDIFSFRPSISKFHSGVCPEFAGFSLTLLSWKPVLASVTKYQIPSAKNHVCESTEFGIQQTDCKSWI
ncbi:hypothetical protein JEQ12_010942, partial [Ovis aries]